jgi:hypothetical protein
VELLLDAATVAIPPFPTLAPPLPEELASPPAPPLPVLLVVAGPCELVLCAPLPFAPPAPPGLPPHAATTTTGEQSNHTRSVDSAMDSDLESDDSEPTRNPRRNSMRSISSWRVNGA